MLRENRLPKLLPKNMIPKIEEGGRILLGLKEIIKIIIGISNYRWSARRNLRGARSNYLHRSTFIES